MLVVLSAAAFVRGGQKLLFASFKINSAAERKEAMAWCRKATFTAGGTGSTGEKNPGRKEAFDPGAIRRLQATLPAGWKNDGTILNVRRFMKDGKERFFVFAILHRGGAPKSAEALAELAKKDPNLFPHREWVKTTGIGKLPDGFFIVGRGKAGGAEGQAIGAVRTIGGATVLFSCVPADDAAARKEMLGIVRSAKFMP
jgi:hypothetical protein